MSDTETVTQQDIQPQPTQPQPTQGELIPEPGQTPEKGGPRGGSVDVWSDDFDIDAMDGQPVGSDSQAPNETGTAEDGNHGAESGIDREKLEELHRQQLESDEKLPQPIVVKYKGKYLPIETLKELKDLAERGVMSTQKAQEAAELKRMLEGIEPDDIELLRRARAGDVEAAQALMAKGPAPEPLPQSYQQAEEIAKEILSKPYAEEFRQTMETVPPQEREIFIKNPQLLKGLQIDFENGTAKRLMPKVEKYMAVNGMDFITAYGKAASEDIGASQPQGGSRQSTTQPGSHKQSMERQLTSMPSVGGTSVMGTEPQERDVWSMDDNEFRRLMDKMI